MKKLIFLTVTTVLFGAFANVYGQCTEDEMSPAAGVPHVYQVAVSGPGYNSAGNDGQTGIYQWYVTKDATDLLNGTILGDDSDFNVAVEGGFSTYNSTANDPTTTNKIKLTWKTEAITSGDPYFLVLKYTGSSYGTCDAMNMKVMKIEPLNRFMLDIEPVQDENGTEFDADARVCADDVDGASYDASADKVTYTYGENTLYYKITASGFAGQWKPQIKLPALEDAKGQKYVSAHWKDATGTWHDFGVSPDGTEQELTSTDLATIPYVEGVAVPTQDYIVRVVIDNERFENKSGQDIEVATDGTYGGDDNDALKDQKDNCAGEEGEFNDKKIINIKARPNINATSGEFVQEIH